jgi:hypothetical protein
MESLTLLKEEINKTWELWHDLAKWKLGATAALGAAAFGLSRSGAQYWLLLFVPFVCAYIDLIQDQYELRILIIARFLREHGQTDVLQAYERECQDVRKRHRFLSLSHWARFGSSIGLSASGPVLYALHHHYYHPAQGDLLVPPSGELLVPPSVAGVLWTAGLLLIIILWVFFTVESRKLSGERLDVSEIRFGS